MEIFLKGALRRHSVLQLLQVYYNVSCSYYFRITLQCLGQLCSYDPLRLYNIYIYNLTINYKTVTLTKSTSRAQ